MVYRVLADFIVVVHFIWILFIIFGVVFAFFRFKIALLHLAGLVFSLLLNLMGWYCPLTYLENYLYSLHGYKSTDTGSFLLKVLEPLVYPNLPEYYIRIGEILFVCLYIIVYAYLAKKYRILDRIKRG